MKRETNERSRLLVLKMQCSALSPLGLAGLCKAFALSTRYLI